MTPEGWAGFVRVWAAIWPDRPFPDVDEAHVAWHTLLIDVDDTDALDALTRWARDPDRGWPPRSPGDILGALRPPDGGWETAIGDLVDAIRRGGGIYGRTPDDLDPLLVDYVRSMGGWRRLCTTFDASDPTIRAQFRDFHRSHTVRAATEARALPSARHPLTQLGSGDG